MTVRPRSGRRDANTNEQRACDGMKLDEFKEQVRHTFGDDLHRASPAAVRDFLDRLQEDMHIARISSPGSNGLYDRRIDVDESAKSYEEVMRTFFAHVLDLPPEEAVTMLWAVAFDLSYAIIASHDADRIGHLFRGLEEPTP
jgi:hypothetical protein